VKMLQSKSSYSHIPIVIAKSRIFVEIFLRNLHILTNEKWHFWQQNPLVHVVSDTDVFDPWIASLIVLSVVS